MTNMPDSIFNGLRRFYDNPSFRADVVQGGSMAARSLCMWVRAVYEFCLVHRALEPKRQQLQRAEQELEKVRHVPSDLRKGNVTCVGLIRNKMVRSECECDKGFEISKVLSRKTM